MKGVSVPLFLLWICLAFVAGILFVFAFSISLKILLLLAIFLLFLISLFWRYRKVFLFSLLGIFFVAGAVYYVSTPNDDFSSQETIAIKQLQSLRNSFQDSISLYIPPPEGEILSAVILGNKKGLSREIKEKLNKTGTRHITAISGMHVAILTGMIVSFLLGIGMWRRHAMLLTILIIFLFILFTGFQISAIRAGIMGGMVFAGKLAGREANSLRGLVFAATAMLLLNPLIVSHLSFQLSFLAVLGIILSLPFLQKVFSKLPSAFGVRDILAMTIGAQIFTIPVLVSAFGTVSIVSILANILVVPVIPFVLASGGLFLLAATIADILAVVFSFVPFLFLSYLTIIVEFFAKLPFASVSLPGVFAWVSAFFSVMLGLFLWKFHKKGSMV